MQSHHHQKTSFFVSDKAPLINFLISASIYLALGLAAVYMWIKQHELEFKVETLSSSLISSFSEDDVLKLLKQQENRLVADFQAQIQSQIQAQINGLKGLDSEGNIGQIAEQTSKQSQSLGQSLGQTLGQTLALAAVTKTQQAKLDVLATPSKPAADITNIVPAKATKTSSKVVSAKKAKGQASNTAQNAAQNAAQNTAQNAAKAQTKAPAGKVEAIAKQSQKSLPPTQLEKHLLALSDEITGESSLQKISGKQPKYIKVRAGDSLWKLAKRALGNGAEYKRLIAANPELKNPKFVLLKGYKLKLPGNNTQVATNL